MRYEINEETGLIRRKPIFKDDNTLLFPKGSHIIGHNAYKDNLDLNDIQIDEENLLIICSGAFDGSSLTNIYIPRDIKSIHINDRAFRYCVNMESITLPNNLTYLDNNMFEGCKNLQTVVLPENLTEIGTECFLACDSLSGIYLPEKATVIQDYAFRYCKNLRMVELSDNTEYIGEGAFLGCDSLEIINYKGVNLVEFVNCYGTIEEDMEDINDFINNYFESDDRTNN